MTSSVEQKLAELGLTLPTPNPPLANYVPVVRTGNLLFISGQVSIDAAGKIITGKLGGGVDIATGQAAAKLCAINLLAQTKATIGDLDKVVRVVKLVAFVNSTPDFVDQPKVVNGCSDLLVDVLGDKGRHARSAVGIAALPFDAAVEVEAVIEVA
ncbi:RidA family protein [Xanthobacter agilis]|uniref:Enamine deaminase RidA (YjgF/YER057c/UK114 family) n=1 Tax=Xanthobacter agilis TaxID=47492 RepID=A0ABU0LIF2_XANAG|nr:RidA family protein [Xanthobacter agilis]MDQ0506921.1 enamine deaminase RidA (YjgF/YER057c/UK114 family) [Xanthobacter agilis]